MTKLDIIDKMSFKETITSVELVDLSLDGKPRLVVTTLNGDVRVLEYVPGDKVPLEEICRADGLPPLAAVGVGDVLGNGIPDLVVGGLDNAMRIISYTDGDLRVDSLTPLGSLPTAIGVFNVTEDKGSEVIVATTDGALRCYGWYEVALDKLAHKVLDNPVFSIMPMTSKGMPYNRFVFGDESGYLYLYQYADDRLHERKKIMVGGEITLVATGDVTGDGYSEIMTVSDGKNLSLLGTTKGSMEKIDSVRAPNGVTSVKIGSFWKTEKPRGQIVSSHTNSRVSLLNFIGRQIVEDTSIKTARRASDSMMSVGDINGDSRPEIVQAVGNTVNIIGVSDE
ncbi:MAG: hypothetical protein ACTSV3_05995 [Candidatus Thorarchaeota archaeon]|nr:MAG: hypothetical protein DRP09_06225 [Candidatus Thorarchaeota archaeon]RLI59962.1 MAG: hypothetical protein DRO87_01265 [Candidatus Thorarchaeota archaeon]